MGELIMNLVYTSVSAIVSGSMSMTYLTFTSALDGLCVRRCTVETSAQGQCCFHSSQSTTVCMTFGEGDRFKDHHSTLSHVQFADIQMSESAKWSNSSVSLSRSS